MNRRRFLKASAIAAGALALGGGAIYAITRDRTFSMITSRGPKRSL
jgi:anaerobic selenocysteine-containing dehydrogenase